MRILVVDDERAIAVMLSRLLSRLGHEPVVALGGDEALELFEEQAIAAVITDIDMPGMNGVELARTLRDRAADVPIAFCTGSDPSGDVARDAAEIGPVWPKVATLESVERVVSALAGPAVV